MKTEKQGSWDLASSPQAWKRGGEILEQGSLKIDMDIKLSTKKESALADKNNSELL